jgi:Ca-activated chloride channel family protein
LFLLALLPLLVAGYLIMLRRRRKLVLRYASLNIIKDAMGKGPGFRRHVPPILMFIALAIMLLAMARPAAYVTLPSERGTVILAMDVSGSMRATDVEPNRFVAAQEAAKEFVAHQGRHVRIGVVSFASTAAVVQTPTDKKDEIYKAIDRFSGQFGTATGSGILVSLMALFDDIDFSMAFPGAWDDAPGARGSFGPGGFARGRSLDDEPVVEKKHPDPVEPGSYKSAVVILLTDGQANTGPDPVDMARLAADRGVRVFTVGVGTEEGSVLRFGQRSMRVQLDEESLKRIADITRAKYFRATSADELTEIYKELSTQLVMEREETEITAFFTAAAALFAFIAVFLSFLWFHRIA